MSVNVDAANERLNGLVTLLKAVGIDSLDKTAVDRVSKNMMMTSGGKNHSNAGSKGSYPSSSKLDDDQIEAIIRKLQMSQQSGDGPQILAALEAAASAPMTSSSSTNRNTQSRQRVQQTEEEEDESEEEEEEEEEEDDQDEEEDDDDDDDDDEGSDEFDEDANYPMVGHGVSDDISVVSDLTTPTVVSSLHVPDEEHYRDALPPMIVGGGANSMLIAPSKRKNLVGGVRSQQQVSSQRQMQGGTSQTRVSKQHQQQQAVTGARTSGGAAAARRKTHNSAMDKISGNTNGMATTSKKVAGVQSSHIQTQRIAPPPQQQQQAVAVNKVRKPANAAINHQAQNYQHHQVQQPVTTSSTPRKMNRKGSMEHTSNQAFNNVNEVKNDAWEANGWSAFADTTNTITNSAKPAQTKQPLKKKVTAAQAAPTTIIDNDGFLMSESFDPSFDPFNIATTAATVANQFRTANTTPSSTAVRSTAAKKKKLVAPAATTQMTAVAATGNNNTNRKVIKQAPPAIPTPAEKRREMRRRASLDC